VLGSLNAKMMESSEYAKINVNDFMNDMSHNQRHMYILKLHEGLSVPIFSYYWARGGNKDDINPHVIWLLPPQLNNKERDEGLIKSPNNIDFLNKNRSVYRSRAKRTNYLATVVNTNFVNGVAVAQVIFEFITGGQMSINFVIKIALQLIGLRFIVKTPISLWT